MIEAGARCYRVTESLPETVSRLVSMATHYRCSACESDDHDRSDHYSARKALQRARALEEAGRATEARFWARVAVDLIKRETAERRAG